jgi:hypothetical protein
MNDMNNKPKRTTPNVKEVGCKSLLADEKSADYGGLEHVSTMIVCNSMIEAHDVLSWAEEAGKNTAPYMWTNSTFPYCLSVSGDIVGWTKEMDRALNYQPYSSFASNFLS